jgi:beta-galactosidase
MTTHLPLWAVVLVVVTTAPASLAWPRVAPNASPTIRPFISLNADWRFRQGAADDEAGPTGDDARGEVVQLPHTWNARDGQDGGGDYYRGPGWYWRPVDFPDQLRGRRLFVRFGAANTVADVFLNGEHLGQHRGGFAAFCLEITPHVRFGRPNLLAVRVDNRHFDDVPPWSADFTFFGGLYRDVQLLVTNPVCITPLDYAAPGVYLVPTRVTVERAEVDVVTKLSNGVPAEQSVTVITTVQDAARRPVAVEETPTTLRANSEGLVTQHLAMDSPHLWNGRADPYVYTVQVQLAADGRIVDEVRQPLGLRTFRVDPDRGFFLNGAPLDLHGVSRHQDRLDRGWAIGRKEHDEDFALIQELGCTAVRLAHYQHDDYAYTLCDQAGLIVWAEIPLIDRISDTPAFRSNCRQQLVELIRQNYNHPSILFWGVHNEITAPWRAGPDPADLIGDLAQLARQEDPTRKVVCAATDPVDHPANWQTDLVAFNRYFGWYGGQPEDLGDWVDRTHRAHPDRPLGISEYGAGASVQHHEVPPRLPRHDGPWHPEEWQAQVHEVQWPALQARPYLWCKFLWNMFDFASDARNEGDAPGRNDKGLVTYDRQTKKDAFYWYKAQWSQEPFVHLTSRRFKERPGTEVTVRAYSNGERVELWINDTSLGTQSGEHHIFEWVGVKLRPGINAIRTVATCGTRQVEDSCRWTGRAE